MKRVTSRLGCGFVLALTLAGCTGLPAHRPSPPRADVRSLDPSAREAARPVQLDVLETQVMRFADRYVASIAQVVDDFKAQPGATPEARILTTRWKLSQGTVAFVNATGANPVLNVLDMVVLATASRLVVEGAVAPEIGAGGPPLVEIHRRLEAEAWTAVSRVLSPELQQELRSRIEQWHAEHPRQRYVAATRLQELAVALGMVPQTTSTKPNSVFRLLLLDPLAGLDPTAAALQQTRRLAERAMYYSQRMPSLLSWQVELLSLELAHQPETRQVLADAERLTQSFERFGKLAEQLPQLVNDQRQAAIQQVFDGLIAEEAKTRVLLTETRATLEAGREMATATQTAVQSLAAFVASLQPATNAATGAAGAVRRPFDVQEYGAAAMQVAAAAEQLNTLVTTLNETAPQLDALLDRTGAQSRAVVDYAFARALVLLAVGLVGLGLVLVAYRRLAVRWDAQGPARDQRTTKVP